MIAIWIFVRYIGTSKFNAVCMQGSVLERVYVSLTALQISTKYMAELYCGWLPVDGRHLT